MSNELPSPRIISGPEPDECGDVVFVVQIGERAVSAFADMAGCTMLDDDLDVAGAVAGAVSDFRRRFPERLLACALEAARLRRAAGNPPRFAVAIPPSVAVMGEPTVESAGPRFHVRVGTAKLDILVTRAGAVADDYSPDGQLAMVDLEAAYRAVLDHIFAHGERAPAWGIDLATLELLWT
jgi:hypothetical protein